MSDLARTESSHDSLLQDAITYLDDTAPERGGRNTRPLAIAALVTSFVASARTHLAVTATVNGIIAAVALWLGLTQLSEPKPLMVLAIVAFVVAAAVLTVGVVLGRRVLRTGSEAIAALRRWHAVAPEVPVRGAETLAAGAGLVRLIWTALALLGGVGAVVGAIVLGTLAGYVAGGVAAVVLLGSGVVSLLGWLKVRGLLRTAAPQQDADTFAPAQQELAPGSPGYVPQASQQPWRAAPATSAAVPFGSASLPATAGPAASFPQQAIDSGVAPEHTIGQTFSTTTLGVQSGGGQQADGQQADGQQAAVTPAAASSASPAPPAAGTQQSTGVQQAMAQPWQQYPAHYPGAEQGSLPGGPVQPWQQQAAGQPVAEQGSLPSTPVQPWQQQAAGQPVAQQGWLPGGPAQAAVPVPGQPGVATPAPPWQNGAPWRQFDGPTVQPGSGAAPFASAPSADAPPAPAHMLPAPGHQVAPPVGPAPAPGPVSTVSAPLLQRSDSDLENTWGPPQSASSAAPAPGPDAGPPVVAPVPAPASNPSTAPVVPAPAPVAAAPGQPTAVNPDDDLYATRMAPGGGPAPRPLRVLLDDGTELATPATTVIGRAPQLRPEDAGALVVTVIHPTVSKTHATVRTTAQAVFVTDRGSTNGITIMSTRGESERLQPWTERQVPVGGEVRLGSFRMRITDEAPAT